MESNEQLPAIRPDVGAWRPLDVMPSELKARLKDSDSRLNGRKPVARRRSHLPISHEHRHDAVDASGPVMRVTWSPIPRQENPAHLHLQSLESPAGARSKMYLLNNVARMFGATDYECLVWQDLTAATITAIMAKLRDGGYQASTRNAYLTAMKATAREAWSLKQMDLETYERIKLVKRIKQHKKPAGQSIKIEVARALIHTALNDGTPTAKRNGLMLLFMFALGIRREEVVNIRVPDDLWVDTGEIYIRGKGSKDRLVKPPEQAWEMLISYMDKERSWEKGALFCPYWNKRSSPKISDKPMDVTSVNHIMEKARKQCEALTEKAITPHDLRRTFATIMHERGMTARELQVVLGHANMATTELYIRDATDEYRDKAAKLGADII